MMADGTNEKTGLKPRSRVANSGIDRLQDQKMSLSNECVMPDSEVCFLVKVMTYVLKCPL